MNINLSRMNSNENCPICFLPMSGEMINLDTKKTIEVNTDVIGHLSLNTRCCYHRDCLEEHVKITKTFCCYVCGVPFMPSSLNVPKEKLVVYAKTLKDRALDELNLIGKDALIGASTGLALGTLDLLGQGLIFKAADPSTLAGMALGGINHSTGAYSSFGRAILSSIVISSIESLAKEAVIKVIGTAGPQAVVFIATVGLTTTVASVVLNQFYRNVFDPIFLNQWRESA